MQVKLYLLAPSLDFQLRLSLSPSPRWPFGTSCSCDGFVVWVLGLAEIEGRRKPWRAKVLAPF
jgi:hypothetical protein